MFIQYETHLGSSREMVYAFHARPENLMLLEDHKTFRLLEHGERVLLGGELWIERRVGILPIVLAFRHVQVEPPSGFTDEMFHGPFADFQHRHRFISAEGGTIVRDEIELALPWQFGGEPVLRRLVLPRLRHALAARHMRYTVLEAQGLFATAGGETA